MQNDPPEEVINEAAMSTGEQTRSCDEISFLSSRALDLDLDKSEALSFYRHIVHCQACRDRLAELVVREQECLEAGRRYETFSLTDDFNQKVLAILAAEQPAKVSFIELAASRLTAHWQGLKAWFRYRPLLPVALGLTMAIGLAAVLWLWNAGAYKGYHERLFFQDIPLQLAKDEISWNHTRTVPPNYDLYVRVQKRDPQPYFFRLSAQQPVKVFLMHTVNDKGHANQREVILSGIRYATLSAPQPNDIVLIRNQGLQPLQVNAYTPLPESIDLGMEQYRK